MKVSFSNYTEATSNTSSSMEEQSSMSTPNGYNNPAYCHQYDSTLYDYQYVPEIDPDSPDLDQESNRRQTKILHLNYQGEFSTDSEGNVGSDESNGSIIIEECNNRRVTMICEKRSHQEYEERNGRATYYQDVSLESENGYDHRPNTNYGKTQSNPRQNLLRHQRPLEPPAEQPNSHHREYLTLGNKGRNHCYSRSQRQHRYEEIPGDEDDFCGSSKTGPSVHRYAEISPDENGFPSIKKPIEIQQSNLSQSLGQSPQSKPIRVVSKPRAATPPNGLASFSPPATPSRTHPRNPYGLPLDLKPESPSHNSYSTSPVKTNSFEMSELSPPRSLDPLLQRTTNDQTHFISSPKRQPPIGASPASECQDPFVFNQNRCILPTHLQKHGSKSKSAPNSPKRLREGSHLAHQSPSKSPFDRKVMQIFHIKSERPRSKTMSRDVRENSVRRNISNSFTDPPGDPSTPKRKPNFEPVVGTMSRTPYMPTTVEIVQPKTAVITPIFQRKNHQQDETASGRDFAKMSQTFQSTGNLYKPSGKERAYADYGERPECRTEARTRLKRNQSVPNFAQTFRVDGGLTPRKSTESYLRENQKLSRNVTLSYSPVKKPVENLSPINKSRLSLIERSRSSWSNTDSDYYPRCSTCFIFATIVHLVTATATCAISFYLLSKMGRRYYLDFGIIAGFINFTLGLLGFRSYCWRWLPNRNYVSGFIGLAAFSAFTCAGLSYLIIVRPMAGDPVLDIMGGAIGAVSVLTILLALTGLTMSSCCKAPPPDNRVADI